MSTRNEDGIYSVRDFIYVNRNMKRRQLRFIITAILAFSICSVNAYCQKNDYENLSSDSLAKLGQRLIVCPDSIDAAMEVYTILAGRLYDEQSASCHHQLSIKALNNIGYLYLFHYHDFKKAHRYLSRAADEAEKAGYKNILPTIYLNLASIYSFNDLLFHGESFTEKSLGLHRKAMRIAKEIGNWPLYRKIFNSIIDVASSFDNLQTITSDIRDYRSMAIPKSSSLGDYTELHVRAVEHMLHQRYTDAIRLYHEMLPITEKLEDGMQYRLSSLTLLSKAYHKNGDILYAIQTAEQAVSEAISIQMRESLIDLYLNLAKYYREINDSIHAEQNFILYLKEKDAVFTQYKMNAVGKEKFLADLNTKEEVIRELAFEKKIKDWQISSLCLFLTIIVIATTGIWISYRRLRDHHRQLYEKVRDVLSLEEQNRLYKEAMKLETSDSPVPYNHRLEYHTPLARQSKYSNSAIDQNRKKEILDKVTSVMEKSTLIYTTDFQLKHLAEMTDCTESQLSQVLNETGGKNFYTMLSEYRIKEVCRRMNDPEYTSMRTVAAMGQEVGIKSRSNFSELFKRFTGMTPSQYLKIAREYHNR